ncbi:uncharacterized protein LOC107492423 [Arachis duranensis]|uniref:Uncharacterized protein LOC107492423 n=1 Tax=Arachis duranensis TaxID=130453 RepID=A0A6P4DIS2_ARADU|nr:uncharacterized protein LOC107492423 [Arachis duranensis]
MSLVEDRVELSSTLAEIKQRILQKLGVCGTNWIKKLFYKISIAVVAAGVKYETFVIGSDEDLEVLFHYRRSFLEVRIPELFAKLEDGVDSSGASAPNPQSTTMGGASTSMPVVAPSGPIHNPPCVAIGTASVPVGVPDFDYEVGPDRVKNAMRDDDSTDEPVDIVGDSEEDIPSTTHTHQGASGSGTQQYPLHLSALNLGAIGKQREMRETYVGQGLHDITGLVEFRLGQSFQSKEEAVLSVKDYSIRPGVQYRVMELDHLKYQGKCKEFRKGCTWMIRIALWQRKNT